jgi:two-component system sensor histidine kinase EvgS
MESHARTVLIVEDNVRNQTAAQLMMLRRGWNVVIAHDAREAASLFSDRPFDLVLLDFQLAHADEFVVVGAMRQADRMAQRPRTPILGLIPQAGESDRARAVAVAMDDCLSKPLRAADLYEALDNIERHAQAA